MTIKETVVLRTKDIDNYFEKMKNLVIQRDKIEEEIKQSNKRFKVCKNEIKALDNWIKTQ